VSTRRASRGQKRAAKVKQRQKRVAEERRHREAEARLLDVAEQAAAERLGYRVTAENLHGFSDDEVAEFDALVESLLDDPRAADRELVALLELIEDDLLAAVRETLDRHSQEPARELIARILQIDEEEVPEGETPPGQMLAYLALLEWLTRGDQDGADPELVLAWVADALGPDAGAAARSLSDMLRLGGQEREDAVREPADALGGDLLAVMLRMAAGVAAVRGGGRAEWLREEGGAYGTVGAAV